MVRDITERKTYERTLKKSNERLEQFAYAASHDLQVPLRMVSSYLRLIEDRDVDEAGEGFIAFAADGADRMRTMIDGLIEYSRIETEGDAGQLRQLFQNLLSNVITYSGDEPPRIHVEAESEPGEGATFSVSLPISDDT